MPTPLEGIRVLDLSFGPAGGIATMVLGDFGADVVKVEPPGGDPLRSLPNSPLWLRGKRSVELDLESADSRAEAARLAGGADVLVTTMTDAQSSKFGLGYDQLAAANPALVYTRLSAFGPRGPYANYPGYDGIVAAKSGRMTSFTGVADREGPAFPAVQVSVHSCAQATISGTLAALQVREDSGRGQLIETSLLQGLFAYDLRGLMTEELGRRHPAKFEDDPFLAIGRAPTLNYHPLPTSDGRWLQMGNLLEHLFANYLMAAGLDDVLADPRYEGPQAEWSEDAREALRDRMLLHGKTRSAAEWMETFVEHGGVAATEYRTTQEAFADSDLIENGHIVEQDHPAIGTVRQLGPLARLCETPGSPGAPSRESGADNAEIGSIWNSPLSAPSGNGAQSAPPKGPLDGVTILEFATIIAAPLGVSILADLGARVIKVEPIGGDPYRGMGLHGIMASKTNVSKESICLDLKHPAGRKILDRLIKSSDALVHNYRPGVPERLGMGYEQCEALRPGIVHVSMNGYGPSGPGARRPSTHPIPGAAIGGATMQAGGAHLLTGDTAEELRPIATRLFRANEANPDPNSSVVTASATLLALLAQKRFGIGQQVFVDMLGANAYANADDLIQYDGKAERPSLDVDLLGTSATYRLYDTADGWVFLALPSDGEFAAFCREAAASELAADERFATTEARANHDSELGASLTQVLAGRTADAWEGLLAPKGIGCVRADASSPGEFFLDDPHVQENEFVLDVDHPRFGRHKRWGPAATLHGTPAVPGPGPLGGNRTRDILNELGYEQAEVESLYADDVVWSEQIDAM